MNIFKEFGAFIKSLFNPTVTVQTNAAAVNSNTVTATTTTTSQPADIVESDVQEAIAIVNNVKSALASKGAVLITSLIPGTVDDEIRETLVNDLPAVVAGLTFATGLLTGSDKSTQINALLANVKLSDKADQDALFHSLAARVLTIVSGGKVSWSNAVMAIEYYYSNLLQASAEASAAPIVSEADGIVKTAIN